MVEAKKPLPWFGGLMKLLNKRELPLESVQEEEDPVGKHDRKKGMSEAESKAYDKRKFLHRADLTYMAKLANTSK